MSGLPIPSGYWLDEQDDFDLCDHFDFGVDWQGRAECVDRGLTWWATKAETERSDARTTPIPKEQE